MQSQNKQFVNIVFQLAQKNNKNINMPIYDIVRINTKSNKNILLEPIYNLILFIHNLVSP